MSIELEIYEVYEIIAATLFFLITLSVMIFVHDSDSIETILLEKELSYASEIINEETSLTLQTQQAQEINLEELKTKNPTAQISSTQTSITLSS